MSLLSRVVFFSVGFLLLITQLSCKQSSKKTDGVFEKNVLTIDQSFSSTGLNDKVKVSTKLHESDLKRANLKEFILKDTIVVKQKKSVISLGEYHKNPEAWFYIKIVNAGNTSRNLVVEESNHLRCDGLSLFTFDDKGVRNLGQVYRTTPLAERKIPFFVYAVPLKIAARDTLNLLIRSQRFHAYHEVSLSISDNKVFLNQLLNTFTFRLIDILLVVISTLILFILGWMFSDKKMLLLSLFLAVISISTSTFFGFIDWLMLYPNISIASTPIFMGFLNASYLPYASEVLKSVPKNEKWFKVIVYSLFSINICASCCYFLPLSWLIKIDTYLIMIIWILVIISTIWLIYWSIMALIRAKIYYFFVSVSIMLLPFLYEQIIILFLGDDFSLYLRVDLSIWLLVMISIVILSVFQLREKLVTRRKYDSNLNRLKESMEDIRKTEIEVIGRNLHDNVGNILASALGYLNLKSPNTDLSQHLVKEAINEIRFLSHNLVKDEDIPLSIKLETLIGRFNDFSNIMFTFDDFSAGKINVLEKTTQQNIYMITQEVLTNIIKHSKATEAYIQIFERENETLQVTIEDDGIGMQNFEESRGIGLKNINKRAKLSSLKLTVDSTPAGTNFIIETQKMP
ncbi:MAG: sensor histidine kinase [Flavobacterium sp.]